MGFNLEGLLGVFSRHLVVLCISLGKQQQESSSSSWGAAGGNSGEQVFMGAPTAAMDAAFECFKGLNWLPSSGGAGGVMKGAQIHDHYSELWYTEEAMMDCIADNEWGGGS